MTPCDRPAVHRHVAVLATLVAALCACTSSSSSTPEPDPTTSPSERHVRIADHDVTPSGEPETVDLRVMTFNIEYGGEEVDFSSVAKAIEAAEADVVAINEGYGNMAKIAADLGWPYYDVRSQVVSRLPLLTPAESDDVVDQPRRQEHRRACRPGRDRPRPRRGDRQRAPAVVGLRPVRGEQGSHGARGRGDGGARPDAGTRAFPGHGTAAHRRRRAGVRARRLQRSFRPGLDRRDRRASRTRRVPPPVADERGRGGERPGRLVPGRAPGPGRRPGTDVAGRPPVREGLQPR